MAGERTIFTQTCPNGPDDCWNNFPDGYFPDSTVCLYKFCVLHPGSCTQDSCDPGDMCRPVSVEDCPNCGPDASICVYDGGPRDDLPPCTLADAGPADGGRTDGRQGSCCAGPGLPCELGCCSGQCDPSTGVCLRIQASVDPAIRR